MWRSILYSIQLIILFLVYFFTARWGLGIDATSGFASLVWLPSGIALAFVLLFGYSMWPAITIAAYLANLLQGASYPVAMGIATGNTLEALIGVYLLNRFEFKKSLERLRDALLLILLAAPATAFISATFGVVSLFLGKIVSLATFLPTWNTWWMGNVISVLVITPLILTWKKLPQRISLKRIVEALVLTGTTIGIGIWVFLYSKNPVLTYLVFPPLMLISLRFGKREASSATLVLLALAIWGSAQDQGPFATGDFSRNLIHLQGFMGVIASTTLIVSVIASERAELERRKDDLISIVSHELKTPLAGMQANLYLLKRVIMKKKDKSPLSFVDRIDGQIANLTGLINDLLDVSKIQAGKVEFRKEEFSLKNLIDETVGGVQQATKTHEIIVKSHLKNDVINSDKQRIGQVLTNLLSNAIKYSPKGKKVIVSTAIRVDKVIISVKDYGFGINNKEKKRIFQRHFRANETIPGFGIGLYVSSEIIKNLGGEMWVESVHKKGSTFYFSVPRS
jgi:signal transduction histidine kinase